MESATRPALPALAGKILLALLLCAACIPAQSLAFAQQAWAAEKTWAYAALYSKSGGKNATLLIQSTPAFPDQNAEYGTKIKQDVLTVRDDGYAYTFPAAWGSDPENQPEEYNVRSIYVCDKVTAPEGKISFGFPYCTKMDLRNLDVSRVTLMNMTFAYCSALRDLDISTWDTSNVTSMYGMFAGCESLQTLDVSHFDTSNVTNMEYMFSIHTGFDTAEKTSLEYLDVSGFDTSKVTSMWCMFDGLSALKSLDVSSFNTENVTFMGRMFKGLSSIKRLDLSSFDTSQVTRMDDMFEGCTALTTILATNRFTAAALEDFAAYEPDGDKTVSGGYHMFENCMSLQGGSGTKFNDSLTDETYARIDTPNTPGYFTQGTFKEDKPSTPPSTSVKPAQPISIARAQVAIKNKAYTGKTLKPSSVTVKVGGKNLVAKRDFTFSCKGGRKIGSYKVTIKGIGKYTGTKTATFKILPKGTSIKKAKASKRGFTVAWKKPSKANLKQTTGYKVQWSTDKKFKKAVKSKLVKKSKTASLKVSKLKGGKRYYVRVCTYKKIGSKFYYSNWSKTKVVKTKK